MAATYETELVLPDYYFPSVNIEGNKVERLAHESIHVAANVSPTENKNAVVIETDYVEPFNRFYVIKNRKVDFISTR